MLSRVYFFVPNLLRSEAWIPQTISLFCSSHSIKPGKLTNWTQNHPKPDTTIIHANMGKHLFMLKKSFGLVVHRVALWFLMSLWGLLLMAHTPRCWAKTRQPSSKKLAKNGSNKAKYYSITQLHDIHCNRWCKSNFVAFSE